MSTSTRNRACRAEPVRWLRPGQVCWLLVALMVMGGGAALWNGVLLERRIAPARAYVGQLSPDADPVVVTLPRGAILEKVLIARDDDIRPGQTLATLDTAAMTQARNALERDMLHDEVLRDCLLDDAPPEGTVPALPEKARAAFETAVQDCRATLEERAVLDRQLEERLSRLAEDHTLIARYRTLLEEEETEADLAPDRKRQALALALLGNRRDRQEAQARLEADRAVAAWNDARLARVRKLAKDMTARAEALRRLQDLLDAPRLTAPRGGRVTRVRPFDSETALTQDIDLIELRAPGEAGFEAHFDVPHHEVQGIEVGNRVRLKMLGLAEGGPALFGRVSDLQAGGTTTVRARVTLDAQSLDLLEDPRTGLALNGRGTASLVHVQKDETRVRDLLGARLRVGLMGAQGPWLVQRIAAALNRDTPPLP